MRAVNSHVLVRRKCSRGVSYEVSLLACFVFSCFEFEVNCCLMVLLELRMNLAQGN